MEDLKYYTEKIKEKRKQTNFRDFLMEIASWSPLVFHKMDGLISRYPKTDRILGVANTENVLGNNTQVHDNGFDFNFDKTFFQNYEKLQKEIYLPNMINFFVSENSDFADVVNTSKNAYLSIIVIFQCENVLYSLSVKDNSYNVLNSLMVNVNCENIYFSSGIFKSSSIFYSKYIKDSHNIWFSSNLIGCEFCIDCHDLENQKYCISNKKYSKQEFLELKIEYLKNKDNFLSKYRKIKTKGKNYASQNVSGNYVIESENITNGHFANNIKNGKNLIFTGGAEGNENMYDIINGGAPSANNIYGVNGVGNGAENVFNSINVPGCNMVYYSFYLDSCHHCFGCIGLQNKSYCILNKQYSKQDWEVKVCEIFSKMETEGVLGEFFPGELNPFYFNDTMAGLIGNFSKQEVEEKGYLWRDEKIKVDIPEGSTVISIDDLGKYQGYDVNNNWRINPDILKVVIKDEKGNCYRIVQMEYDFLVKHALPLPEIHWMERMKLNFGM